MFGYSSSWNFLFFLFACRSFLARFRPVVNTGGLGRFERLFFDDEDDDEDEDDDDERFRSLLVLSSSSSSSPKAR